MCNYYLKDVGESCTAVGLSSGWRKRRVGVWRLRRRRWDTRTDMCLWVQCMEVHLHHSLLACFPLWKLDWNGGDHIDSWLRMAQSSGSCHVLNIVFGHAVNCMLYFKQIFMACKCYTCILAYILTALYHKLYINPPHNILIAPQWWAAIKVMDLSSIISGTTWAKLQTQSTTQDGFGHLR